MFYTTLAGHAQQERGSEWKHDAIAVHRLLKYGSATQKLRPITVKPPLRRISRTPRIHRDSTGKRTRKVHAVITRRSWNE
ncbi:hypothetical protein PTI98_012528 [Pleurotus ostreatus]|nr:hypothetical protein PTI98_012528 [Pleurotus ostreatus]